MKLTPQKLEGWGYRMVEFHNPNFSRFCMIHSCDGQAIAYSTLSIYAICCHAL